MYGNYYSDAISVTSGRSSGRSTYDRMKEGTVRISGIDEDGKRFERVVKFEKSEIFESTLKVEGKVVHHIAYGKFETELTPQGREITHFRRGTGRGLHGLSRRFGKLFGAQGVCTSWYKHGRLVRQSFRYDGGRVAYNWSAFGKSCAVRNIDGSVRYEVKGALDGRGNCYFGGPSVFDRPMKEWFTQSTPFEVRNDGKVVYAGQWSDRQKVGEWVEEGKRYFYERGLAIPKKLYQTPPEKLDPVKILKLPNAQLRMALAAKIGPEKIARCGTVIHEDGEMRLIEIKGYDVKILRVQCPSTKQYYFLRVPHDSKKCEEARQWTFGVGDGIRTPIKFDVET